MATKRTTNPNVAVLVGLVLVLVFAGASLLPDFLRYGNAAQSDIIGLATTEGALGVSTPRDQWKRGVVPLLLQTDSEWAVVAYADGTIETHGCGPTCLSMVYIALTGKTNLDPAGMGAFSENHGYVEEGLTSWRLMSEGAAQLGLKARELSPTVESVTVELSAGHPIICSVGPGDFTTKGHFIVLAGIDHDGNLIVRDPNSATRSQSAWNTSKVLSQCRNLWSFSA